MNFEPQKFFIGLMDFFSILLPGALLTYLFSTGGAPFSTPDPIPGGVEGWLLFLFGSYLLGHLAFLLGSWLMDDHVYDRLRNGTYEGQIRKLANGKDRPGKFTRALAKHLKLDADATLRHALAIKDRYVERPDERDTINAFQWSKAHLALQHRDALAAVERFEADSKFFRSLIIVLLIVSPWMLVVGAWETALATALLLLPASWRYIDQRSKAVNQAYYLVIASEAQKQNGLAPTLRLTSSAPTHAGGVVYREKNDTREYLLVESTRKKEMWVLPKGHIKPGERPAHAAVREVREEAGAWARVVAQNELGVMAYDNELETVSARIYLMEHVADDEPVEERRHVWLPYDAAVKTVTYDDAKDLLTAANNKLIAAAKKDAARNQAAVRKPDATTTAFSGASTTPAFAPAPSTIASADPTSIGGKDTATTDQR